MPIARIQMPDGRIARMEVPEGTTPEQAQTYAENVVAQPSVMDQPNIEQAPSDINASGATSRFLQGLGHGLKQLVVGAQQRMGQVTPQQVEQQRAQFAPVGNTTAGQVGNFIGETLPAVGASALIPAGGALYTAATQGLLGGAQGALQPTGINESPVTNAFYGGLGGAAGGLGSSLVSRLLTPVPGVSPAKIDLAHQAEAAGYPATVGQVTGNPWIKRLEQTAGGQAETEAAKTSALNRIATKAIGVPSAEDLSPQTLEAAYKANNAARQQLVQTSILNTTHPNYINAVRGIIDNYNLLTPTNQRAIPKAQDYIRDLVNWAQQGSINGDVYQANRSVLSRLARTSTGAEQHFYSSVIDALDAAAPQSQQWATVNNQYKTLKQLDKPGMIDASGNINGRALWAATQGQQGANSANPLREAATYAKAFPQQPVNNNSPQGLGNAIKFAGLNALTGAAGGSVGSYYYGARDPTEILHSAALGGGMGILGPHLLGAVLKNPILKQYLMRGVIGGMDFTPFLTRLSPFAAQGEMQLQQQRALEAQQNAQNNQ